MRFEIPTPARGAVRSRHVTLSKGGAELSRRRPVGPIGQRLFCVPNNEWCAEAPEALNREVRYAASDQI